jgi:hypothetical protein
MITPMENLEIIDQFDETDFEIEDQDIEIKYPDHLFNKISPNVYQNKSNNMLHLSNVPITSETIHRYLGKTVKGNLEAQGIDSSKYNIKDDDIVYVGNPIEEIERCLPALHGMKSIKRHSKIDIKNSPKKDLYMGHLTKVNIKQVRNRPTAVAEELILDDMKSIEEVITHGKRGVSIHWTAKIQPIADSQYKDKQFISDRYKNEKVNFVKVDLKPNNLSHVFKPNDELCTIKDEDINNQEEKVMSENKSLAEKLINNLTSVINSVFSGSEIKDEDIKSESREERAEVDKYEYEQGKKAEKKDEDNEEKKDDEEKSKKDKSEIKDEDVLERLKKLEEENLTLKERISNIQEIADQDIENSETSVFIRSLALGTRGEEIIKDKSLSTGEKLNQVIKTYDTEIADEDISEDISGKKFAIKLLQKEQQNKLKMAKMQITKSKVQSGSSDEISKLLNEKGL